MYKKYYEAGSYVKLGGHVGVFFELIIEMIYSKTLHEGDLCIDGGVNIGLHTFPMSSFVGPTGVVLGFEALSDLTEQINSKILSKNIDNIKIVNKAIGSNIGITDFIYVKDLTGLSGIKKVSVIPEYALKNIVNLSVPVTTIDHEVGLLDTTKSVRFIKLDLEGGEYDALKGASVIMKNHAPLIVFENNRDQSSTLYGYDKESWFKLFENHEYKLYDLFGREFSPNEWHQADMPWYVIAAKRDIDIQFIKTNLIDCVEELYKKHIKGRGGN
jgi:FkbM family methyltransferase